jgi:hypothetical protein
MKEAKVIEVSRKLYNTARSIVNSSLKRDYHWNIPICTLGYIKFVKYKNTRIKQWEINIVPQFGPEGRKIGTAIRVFKDGRRIMDFVIREELCEGETSYTLMLHSNSEIIFNVDTLFDLETIYINADVPFSYPICLSDVIEKLLFYLYLAERAKAQAQVQKP